MFPTMVRVLIADDESLSRSSLRAILESRKEMIHSIDEAVDGTQAAALVDARQYDVAFIDVCMPGTNGLSVAERLLSQGRHAEVIIISAYDRFEYAHKAISLRVSGYILKPFDDAVVLDQFDRALGEMTRTRLIQVDDTVRISRDLIEKELLRMFYLGNGRMIELLAESLEIPKLHGFFVRIMGCPSLRDPDVKAALGEVLPRTRVVSDGEGTFLLASRRPRDEQLATRIGVSIRRRAGREPQIFVSEYGEGAEGMCAQLQSILSRVHSCMERGTASPSATDDQGEPSVRPVGVGDEIVRALAQGGVEDVETIVIQELQRLSRRMDLDELRDRAVQIVHALRAVIAKVGLVTKPTPSSVILDCMSKVQNKEELLGCARSVIRTEISGFVPGGRDHVDGRYGHLLDFVNSHIFDLDLSLTLVGDAMGWTTQNVCRVFKRSTGTTFLCYTTEKRLEAAASLFLWTDRSVTDVARSVGFRDVNYFSRLFKRRMGIQPGLYRRQGERSALG